MKHGARILVTVLGAGLCVLAAWLWRFELPLPAWLARGAGLGLALIMVVQAGNLFPIGGRPKGGKRLIVKYGAMRAGSLALFAGAALLLAAHMPGCSYPQAQRPDSDFSISHGSNRQECGQTSALWGPITDATRYCRATHNPSMAGPETLPAIAVSSGPMDRCCAAQDHAGACAPGGIIAAMSQRKQDNSDETNP